VNDEVLIERLVIPRALFDGGWLSAAGVRIRHDGDVPILELLPPEDLVAELERRHASDVRSAALMRGKLDRSEGSPDDTVGEPDVEDALFEHWRAACKGGSAQVLFTQERRRKVRARLREGADAAELIVKAINAVAALPFVVDGGRSSTGMSRQRSTTSS
jgi:hypothetical protein